MNESTASTKLLWTGPVEPAVEGHAATDDDRVTELWAGAAVIGPAATSVRGDHRYRRRLGMLPALGGLTIIWVIVVIFTFSERGRIMERAQFQLENTVATLLDLSVLAERAAQLPAGPNDPDRAAAFWRVLLQYPTAWVWIEVGGNISAGQPPSDGIGSLITAAASSGDTTAHAALAEADAAADWRRSAWQRLGALVAASAGFLIMADRLSRALTRRATAEQEAASAEERAGQLRHYQAQLEETVAQRTTELQEVNVSLEKELSERMAAEAALQQHDALLAAVTKSAAELLGAHNLDDAVSSTLGMIGQTIGVERVQLATIRSDEGGHRQLLLEQAWSASDGGRLIETAVLPGHDLGAQFPDVTARIAAGQQASVYLDDVSRTTASQLAAADARSILFVPIRIGDEPWGCLCFVDSSHDRRTWTWAETDTLTTLAELIGSAIMRAQNIKELADANTIVQNSPTILFRLKGEPSFPLIYISRNIGMYGHEPTDLVASPAWNDLLIDPDDQPSVHSALTRVMEKDAPSASVEFRLLKGDGSRRWMEARYSPVRDLSGRLVEIEGIMIDVTERKAAEDKITQLARTDSLTGLANRSTFIERLNQAFLASQRGASPFAVIYLDLDHFKDTNDTLGHPIGDLLLQSVATRILLTVRESDVVARLGGDEFAVLQSDVVDPASAGALAEKLRCAVAAPYTLEGNTLHVTASLGVAPLAPDTPGANAMLAQADLALYRAKEEGRNQYRFHTEDLDAQVRERVSLSADLRDAIDHNELGLYYQPQIDLTSGAIVGMEALARWHHPTHGLIMPSVFIPIAEKTGTILDLGRWVLDRACNQMRRWQDDGIAPPVIAINISILQLKSAGSLVQDVTEALAKWELLPSSLELDVTESMLAQVAWARNDVLSQLRKVGVQIALDDFGTDYSSFEYLRKYQISHIKIAQSFTDLATQSPEHAQTVRAIINLARELQIGVIAEGIETAEQRAILSSIDFATKVQGFYFSKPVTEAQAGDLLTRGTILPVGELAA